MAHVSFEDLTFRYPQSEVAALREVTLDVPSGSLTLVLGRNGSGKTTLIRQMKTVLAPYGTREGKVLLDGVSIDAIPLAEQAARIGFVLQDADDQIVSDRVWHELAFGLESLGTDERTMRMRVAELVSYFGLEAWIDADVGTLSGGQRQLVCVASVLATHPDVLVLDEPTAELDPIAASSFMATLRKLHRELGCTIIMVEQRLGDAYAMADRVVVLDEGSIRCEGSPQEVAARLFGEGNALAQALPSPTRIFYGVEGTTGSFRSEVPLTVKDARDWLRAIMPEGEGTDGAVRKAPKGEEPKALVADVLSAQRDGDGGAIEARGVWVRYGRELPDVLRDLRLSVARGSMHAIVGGNGCGKTTLLRVLGGIIRPYRGTVRVDGVAVGRRASRNGGQASGALMLPQDPLDIFVHDTLLEDLEEMAGGLGVDAPEAREASCAIAQAFGLERLLSSHPADLSCGELKRAALAKVMLGHPSTLLLDEPTAGLDALAKASLADMLRDLRAQGVTILFASHDLEFCAQTADRVSMMFDGQVVASASPMGLFAENAFYTTSASRISRGILPDVVTDEGVVAACRRALT